MKEYWPIIGVAFVLGIATGAALNFWCLTSLLP